MKRTIFLAMATAVISMMFGCGPKAVDVSVLDSATMASKAMEQYDVDKDGSLSKGELESAPSLQAAIKEFDTDSSDSISISEIQEGLDNWNTSGVGIMTVELKVLMDGKPLPDAHVEFEPERFMGESVGKGTGMTDESGVVTLVAPAASAYGIPGMELGFFRIKITSDSSPVPDTYNENTTLGFAVSPNARGGTGELRLKSR